VPTAVSPASATAPSAPAPVERDLELSIVMPCLNEAETLATCIGKAKGFLDRSGIRGEVVIADNGSSDGSQAIATRLGARVVPVEMRGYGAALSAGSTAARGRYVIMGDSDDSYDFGNLMPFIEALRAGNDLVMGNRFRGGIRNRAMPWKNRYIGNPVLSGIGRLLFNCPARDFHCGLRGYSGAAFQRMNLHTTGMEFASEMVIKATIFGMRIAEVPTTLDKDGRSRPPHLRPWRDGWRHLRFMLLYSPRWLFWYPGFAMLLCGLPLGVRLAFGPLRLGGVTLDVNTMLFCALAVILSFQSLTFGVLSRQLGEKLGVLPRSRSVGFFRRLFNLEKLLLLGAALFIGGLVGGVASVAFWRAADFGNLDPSVAMRRTIPASLACVIGVQTMFFAFLSSVIDLGVKRDEL
jgi:glycosyltransferase involved in cell wall biosynthesis